MTLTELLDLCDASAVRAKELGVDSPGFVVLTTPRKSRGARMQLFPGLAGRVVGSDAKFTIVSVKVPDVMRYLIRHLESVEATAVECAELGDHDGADFWMAQFVALRDRLPGAVPKTPVKPRAQPTEYTAPQLGLPGVPQSTV